MIKIRTSITDFNLQHLLEHQRHDDSTKNKIYDWEEFFRSKRILKINEVLESDWCLDFTQMKEKHWMVDIKCESIGNAGLIKNIIIESLEDFTVECFFNNKNI